MDFKGSFIEDEIVQKPGPLQRSEGICIPFTRSPGFDKPRKKRMSSALTVMQSYEGPE